MCIRDSIKMMVDEDIAQLKKNPILSINRVAIP